MKEDMRIGEGLGRCYLLKSTLADIRLQQLVILSNQDVFEEV